MFNFLLLIETNKRLWIEFNKYVINRARYK
jgi:hypothetical protein